MLLHLLFYNKKNRPSILACEIGMVLGLGWEWGLDAVLEENQNNKNTTFTFFLPSSSATHHYNKLIAPFLFFFQTFSLFSSLCHNRYSDKFYFFFFLISVSATREIKPTTMIMVSSIISTTHTCALFLFCFLSCVLLIVLCYVMNLLGGFRRWNWSDERSQWRRWFCWKERRTKVATMA